MAQIPDLELVQYAFPPVSVIVTNIALRRRHGELGELGAHLCSFALETQELTSQQMLALEKHSTIQDILMEVENIISVPIPVHAVGYYPTLQAIAQSQHTSQDKRTGNTSIRQVLERRIRYKITTRARAGWDFGHSVAVMQARSRIYEYRSPDIMEGFPPSDKPPEYPNQIQALYDVLKTHSACSCIEQSSSKHHLAKLRLSPYSGLQDGDQVKLEMLFSSSPDPMDSGQYDWQETQIAVPSLDLSHRRVRFAENSTDQSGNRKNSIPVRGGEFCELISKRCGSCLHLTVSSGQLYILLDSLGREQQVEPIAGLPLGQVLDKFGLHFGMRPVLAYILARSVWQYYASDWMNSPWNSQTVYFMAERAGGQITAYFCKPYQLIKFGASRQNAVEYNPVVGMMHRYPRILALGIMLVELATGRSILTPDMDIQQCDARTTNIQLCSIREILNTAAFEDDCTFPQYQAVIHKCLDPGLFKNATASPTNPRENLEQRRHILYEEVVYPLKLLVEGTGWNTEFHKLEDTPLTPKGRKPSNEQSRSLTGQIRTSSGVEADRGLPMVDAIPHAYRNGTLDNQAQSTCRPSTLEDYTIGWICALKVEFVAAVELLDVKFSAPPGIPRNDDNVYMCGQMRDHNVVIACLPKGKYGVTAAASVAKDMMRSFIEVHTILMVGIGGGAPSQGHNIRLGDVVVGVPTKELGGVIHYEFGRANQNHGFQRTGHLNSTPTRLLSALQYIETTHTTCGNQITSAVDQMTRNNPMLRDYRKPDPQTDVLFSSSFIHPYNSQDCMQSCIMQTDQIIRRGNPDETTDGPVIHYGLIASADRLMKDANIRDYLAETEGVLCFEMEAAGLMDRCPCVVIRGICDYSDTHKNDRWQGYAAATAAAYAKELLGVVRAY